MPTYRRLDLALWSQSTAGNQSKPIVMAYGWTHYDAQQQQWVVDGQKPDDLNKNDTVVFYVFDASSQENVNQVKIQLGPGHVALEGQGCSPFNDPLGNPWTTITATATATPPVQLQSGGQGQSLGCNVQGKKWCFGPLTVVTPGDFECTATATLDNGVEFTVDPEMEVQGSN